MKTESTLPKFPESAALNKKIAALKQDLKDGIVQRMQLASKLLNIASGEFEIEELPCGALRASWNDLDTQQYVLGALVFAGLKGKGYSRTPSLTSSGKVLFANLDDLSNAVDAFTKGQGKWRMATSNSDHTSKVR